MVRILLGDDHILVREGLRVLLQGISDVQVVGEADNGREIVRLCRDLSPDVVIMDVAMPELNGVEATRRILSEFPDIKVIALSAHSSRQFVEQMIKAGAVGYVLKNSAFEELATALENVCADRAYISPNVAAVVLEQVVHKRPNSSPLTLLSGREREVLQLLAEGFSPNEIALRLNMSGSTVQTHRRNIMEKLGINSIAKLTKFAIREGLTTTDD